MNLDLLGVYFLILIVYLVLAGVGASIMQEIADEKQSNRAVWAWCFWVPVIGYPMVIALPNTRLLNEQKRANELQEELIKKQDELIKVMRMQSVKTDVVAPEELPDL